ncbi:MAG TPA: hypothetical protein VFZ00_03510 [Solirubrobacter sp.]|nr:hypothetical protein [Solirubrobacter sp.]
MLLSRAQDIDGVTVEELVALADGNLPEERRARVEARVAASPRATAALEAQRRSLASTRAFTDSAPDSLAVPAPVPAPAPRYRPRPIHALAFATVLVLLVAAVFATTRAGGPLDAAVALASEPATEPLGSQHDAQRSFAGVDFPDWSRQFGWHATGARRDDADGRASDTVYYEHMGHRIGYTVLEGRALGLPERGRRVVRDGLAIQLFHEGEKSVAVFERNGRTCVLAGKVLEDETLIKLAAWRAAGNQSM